MDGLLLAKTTTDVGLRMANTGFEEFIVRVMIPPMSEDLGSTDQDSCEAWQLMCCTQTKALKSR